MNNSIVQTHNNLNKRRVFFDMDGCLCEFKKVPTLELLYEQGYFANLTPHKNVMGALRMLRSDPSLEVYVLSAYLSDSKYALDEKHQWLDNNISELDHDHRFFTPCGCAKSDAVPGGIREDDILIDDYSLNLHEWITSGGKAIKLMNGINGTKGTWKGSSVSMYDDSEKIAQYILHAI